MAEDARRESGSLSFLGFLLAKGLGPSSLFLRQRFSFLHSFLSGPENLLPRLGFRLDSAPLPIFSREFSKGCIGYCRLLQCSLLCSLLLHKNRSPETDKMRAWFAAVDFSSEEDKLTYFLFPGELGNLNLPLIKEPLDPDRTKPLWTSTWYYSLESLFVLFPCYFAFSRCVSNSFFSCGKGIMLFLCKCCLCG